jgi:hypothetical protein
MSQNFQNVADDLKQFDIIMFILIGTVFISVSLVTEDLDGNCFYFSLLFHRTIIALSASGFSLSGHLPFRAQLLSLH